MAGRYANTHTSSQMPRETSGETQKSCENDVHTAFCVVVCVVAISVRVEVGDAAEAVAGGGNTGGGHDDRDAQEAQPAVGSVHRHHHDAPLRVQQCSCAVCKNARRGRQNPKQQVSEGSVT